MLELVLKFWYLLTLLPIIGLFPPSNLLWRLKSVLCSFDLSYHNYFYLHVGLFRIWHNSHFLRFMSLHHRSVFRAVEWLRLIQSHSCWTRTSSWSCWSNLKFCLFNLILHLKIQNKKYLKQIRRPNLPLLRDHLEFLPNWGQISCCSCWLHKWGRHWWRQNWGVSASRSEDWTGSWIVR